MGKEKKSKLGIKTARFFTKTCSNCNNEYPNWFVSCPSCGSAWDKEEGKEGEDNELLTKKNVKIVAKITEEDFKEPIEIVNLIFSGDQGKSWYKMKMEYETDYYLAEIIEVPIGANIIYYIEVSLRNGEKITENNEGKYFIYRVGTSEIEEPRELTKEERKEPKKDIPPRSKEYFIPNNESVSKQNTIYNKEINNENEFAPEYIENPKEFFKDTKDLTIFGLPQTEKDPDLKICPNCQSKIKKMWNICPICGHRIE
ncbi:MAG: hypothetical protein KGD63_10435 [Candidatus Lokiarchaeota archaeon]|nr:hypothetical protein [Candidatus Lokiarchaeota archaeon]